MEPSPYDTGAPSLGMAAAAVRHRVVRGVAVLLVRYAALRAVNFAGGVVLARILVPRDFGVYAIVSFVVNSVALFGDLGLGAALIQKREEPTTRELRTIFLIQQSAVGTIVLGLALLAGPIAFLYGGKLGMGGEWMIRALALSLLITSFASISSALLERRLEFHRRTIADVAQTLTYTFTAVGLAIAVPSLGSWAFVLAALLGSVASLASLFALAPWAIGWALDRDALRAMFRFGLPYQGATVLSLIKDNISPTLIAVVAGAAAVGWINLAQSLAYLPLTLISVVGRVTFPAFSRLQDQPERLREALEVSVRWISLGTFPAILLMAALAQPVIDYVYNARHPGRWENAVLPIYLFSLPALTASYSTTFITALYALGRAGFMLRLTAIFTIAGWGLALPLVLLMPDHYLGYPAAMALITPLSFLSVREIRKVVRPDFVGWSLFFLLCAVAAALLTRALASLAVRNLPELIGAGCAGGAFYMALVLALRGSFLLREGRMLMRSFRA